MVMQTLESDRYGHIRTLYQDHHGWLRERLQRRLGCLGQAADLAQDTFVRLLAREGELERLREPRAFLATVAQGLLANHWRRQAVERAYLDALAARPQAVQPSPEAQALILETLTELDALLDRLPARVRQAFLLAQLDGLTYAVIAERLGVSERMVKKYMAQAMLHCLELVS
ncbi:sigma-70 family RNA polymerase sigma factor [Pseudomonas sp. HR1]|nr:MULTISPECIES: sigma-70 family RNA polymerase sigma factor [Pseudomonas]MDK4201741.1 sigma-70 family RNA polymerase sigma factor [Pseudomonas sp. HR1]MDU4059356.1 sigma-70 family RNA polymerase sigma factor [Pseudomonas oryzihabitans]